MNIKKQILELKRRNVFKAGIAYLIVAWLITQVASIVLPTFGAPPFILKTIIFILVIGFPLNIVFAWAYELTPDGIKKTKEVNPKKTITPKTNSRLNKIIITSLSVAVILLLVNQFWNTRIINSGKVERGKSTEQLDENKKSVAVLPFANMSTDEEQDYFCYGIAEDILNDLTHLEGIHVVARTSSFAFKDKNQDIREIGKKLGVQSIVEGSVRKAGNKLRITAQLINVADGFRLWSERYDRDLENVFAIQNEIAQNIVQALEIKLSKREIHELEKVKTKDVQAYDFYMRGRAYFNQGDYDKTLLAIQMFKKAIQKDKKYALAYTGLADSYAHSYMYFDRNNENLEQALSVSQTALELDSELAEAHSSRGLALSQNNQFEEAEKEFEKAIQLNPKYFDAYYWFARICRAEGKHNQAAVLFEKATQVDPKNYNAALFLASAYENLNLEDQMNKANKRALEVTRKHLDLYPEDARALYLGAGALIKANKPEEAQQWVEEAISIKPDEISVLYNAACVYSLLGKLDEALDYFEKAIEAGYASREWIDNDSDLDPIRNHLRFQKILKRLN